MYQSTIAQVRPRSGARALLAAATALVAIVTWQVVQANGPVVNAQTCYHIEVTHPPVPLPSADLCIPIG